MHRRTGEQVSGTTRPCDPVRERASKVFEKRSARLLEFSITGRLPSKSGGAAYRRLRRHLLRSVFSKVSTTTTKRYVLRASVWLFTMFSEYMLSCCLFPIILLFSISSMFELHKLVAGFVMIYILKLIVKIMPNNPTLLSGMSPKMNFFKQGRLQPVRNFKFQRNTTVKINGTVIPLIAI